jgi:hypothetical protein
MKNSLKAHRYLEKDEIKTHLDGVEYIIMATPHGDTLSESPIHFSIFLNTDEILPQEIQEAVLEKFCQQYSIFRKESVMSELAAVAFAQTDEETMMPMHLFKPEDQKNIPHTTLHIIDFIGDSTEFKEVKEDGHTGWSYSYN